VTADVLGVKLAGPAIRAWQMAEALAGDHDVVLLSTAPLAQRHSERFEVTDISTADPAFLAAWCDVMVVQGFVFQFCAALRTTNAIIVVDYYDVLHFETLELMNHAPELTRIGAVRAAVDVLAEQAVRGDLFLCSTERQRDLWLGHLAAYGRVNPATYLDDPTLERLVTIVPFGVTDTAPAHTRPVLRGVHPAVPDDAELLLWAGGIYDWFDPLTLIRAVALLQDSRPRLRLFFLGVRHPNPDAVEPPMVAAARQLADDLGVLDRVVVFNDEWVDYDDRQNFLLEADIGVSTHTRHLETEFSFRTRILDHLWAGLPTITTAGDEFARLIEIHGCGDVVPAQDPVALARTIGRLLDEPARRAMQTANARALAAQFTWSTVLRPLVDFCRDPRRAADRFGKVNLGTNR
jgi:glycosyltransferase involved in cell wall biosynthesis